MRIQKQHAPIILKVSPVAGKIPDANTPEEWHFAGREWEAGSLSENTDTKYIERPFDASGGNYRRVMLVKASAENPVQGEFTIDVPNGFFNSVGNFVARPLYEASDVLHVMWTGDAVNSGWVDLNYQQRGGGGGGGGDGGTVCAKWS